MPFCEYNWKQPLYNNPTAARDLEFDTSAIFLLFAVGYRHGTEYIKKNITSFILKKKFLQILPSFLVFKNTQMYKLCEASTVSDYRSSLVSW